MADFLLEYLVLAKVAHKMPMLGTNLRQLRALRQPVVATGCRRASNWRVTT